VKGASGLLLFVLRKVTFYFLKTKLFKNTQERRENPLAGNRKKKSDIRKTADQ